MLEKNKSTQIYISANYINNNLQFLANIIVIERLSCTNTPDVCARINGKIAFQNCFLKLLFKIAFQNCFSKLLLE